MLRLPGEHPIATLREALKIITPLLALGAAVAAGIVAWQQFNLATSRLTIDQRPWVSLDAFSFGKTEAPWWTLLFQVKNSGLTPAQRVAFGLEPVGSEKQFAEAIKKACLEAETSRSALTVFPRDQMPRSLSWQAETTNLTMSNIQGAKYFPLAVVCVVYRSALDKASHHTPYALGIEIEGYPAEVVHIKAHTSVPLTLRPFPSDDIGLAD
jgi:hypothetical protein